MSIISDALNKANAERRPGARTGEPRRSGRGHSWLASVAILALLIVPFAIPRMLNRPSEPGPALPSSVALPLADTPDARVSGLAQVSVESTGFTPALSSARTILPPASGATVVRGIVWTEDKGYYAILNDEVVRVGSRVGGMRVTKIVAGGVELSDGVRSEFIEKSF